MNNFITRQQLIERLEENRINYHILPLQDGISVIVTEYGGRIFGPYFGDNSPSIYWTNKAFKDRTMFKEFLKSGDWNLGGERIWIAPEIQYYVPDPGDFFGSYSLSRQVDPGNYTLNASKEKCVLGMEMELNTYNIASGCKALRIDRTIQIAENPLRFSNSYIELMKDVKYCGYEQIIFLSEPVHDDIVSESWDIVQLNPGGQLYIPMSPLAEVTEYYEPTDSNVRKRDDHFLRLQITGNRRYKIGVKAAGVYERMGYVNQLDEGNYYLLVRNFFNNPSSVYAEEPHEQPGVKGHSVHVFNDKGNLGGFGEMECNGQTIGGETGREKSLDQNLLWLFTGPYSQVKKIALMLLGIRIE